MMRVALLMMSLALLSSCFSNNHPSYQGYIEGEYIYLASPFSGVLIQLAVRRGETVAAHQLVFRLDSQPQLAQYQQAVHTLKQGSNTLNDMLKGERAPALASIEAKIASAQADIELTKVRVARDKKLLSRAAVDRDSYDQAVANLAKATELKAEYEADLANAKLASREDMLKAQRAAVSALQAKLQQAQWKLAQKNLSAPTGGIIDDTYFREGEFVAANQPVASLLSPNNIRVTFFIPETILPHIALGQEITINCDSCQKPYKAVIRYISPQAEYAPPVIYSRDNNYKLLYRIYAYPADPTFFHPGQPVYATI